MCMADVGRQRPAWYAPLLPVMLEMVPIRRKSVRQHEAEDALLGILGLLQRDRGAQCWSRAEGCPLPLAECCVVDPNSY